MTDFKEVCKYTKDLNVLYVEDEVALNKENLDVFKDFFHRVDGALNGIDGLKKYKEFYNDNECYYDMVLTDINMPQMDGHELINEIYKINEEQTIIVISAYNESERLINLIDGGIENFILKPIKMEHLLRIFYKASKNILNDKLARHHLKYVENLNRKLQEYNETLNEKVKEQVEALREKDKILFQNSKLAAMGEMMDAIAHQWKQPLSIIKITTSMINFSLSNEEDINVNELKDDMNDINEQIDHLVITVDEFRKFFRTSFKKEEVVVKEVVEGALDLLESDICSNNIQTQISGDKNLTAKIIPNEFKHVIINMVNNSKDAFVENNIEKRDIKFEISKENAGVMLKIKDNAGGVPADIIGNIFKANFTTKEKNKGTGVGLYMTKMIIEKIGGKIWVENYNGGACFNILIKS